LKYQRFAPSGWKDIGIRRFEFVAKTQLLSKLLKKYLNMSFQDVVCLIEESTHEKDLTKYINEFDELSFSFRLSTKHDSW